MHRDERKDSVVEFLKATVAHYKIDQSQKLQQCKRFRSDRGCSDGMVRSSFARQGANWEQLIGFCMDCRQTVGLTVTDRSRTAVRSLELGWGAPTSPAAGKISGLRTTYPLLAAVVR